MDWKQVGNLVKVAAPTLGTLLLGPPGTALGGAVSMLLGAFGLADGSSPSDVVAKLQADPMVLVRLKEIETTERVKLVDLQMEQLRVDLENVMSARDHEVKLASLGSVSAYGPFVISVIVTVGFFCMLGTVLFYEVPTGAQALTNILLGSLAAAFGAVVNYYIGSSSGSVQKTALLAAADPVKVD